jgi:hypothetical protein
MASRESESQLGFVYVDSQCCTNCGVPVAHAPENFAWGAESCYVKRQPRTTTELRQVLEVFRYQELDCVRYAGRDRRIIRILERVNEGDKVDRDGPRSSLGEQATSCEPNVDPVIAAATAEVENQQLSWWKRLWRR